MPPRGPILSSPCSPLQIFIFADARWRVYFGGCMPKSDRGSAPHGRLWLLSACIDASLPLRASRLYEDWCLEIRRRSSNCITEVEESTLHTAALASQSQATPATAAHSCGAIFHTETERTSSSDTAHATASSTWQIFAAVPRACGKLPSEQRSESCRIDRRPKTDERRLGCKPASAASLDSTTLHRTTVLCCKHAEMHQFITALFASESGRRFARKMHALA